MPDGNLTRSQVHNRRGNKERRDPSRPILQQLFVLALDGPEIADAAADVGADALRDLVGYFQAAVAHGFLRRRNRVLNESAHLARFLLLYIIQRIEVFDFAGKPNGKL